MHHLPLSVQHDWITTFFQLLASCILIVKRLKLTVFPN